MRIGRITYLTAIAVLTLCFLPPSESSAVEFRTKGRWEFSMDHSNRHFLRDNAPARQPSFNVFQRIRLQLDAEASENLSGTVLFDIDTLWGSTSNRWTPASTSGGALGADGMDAIKVTLAYLTWQVPSTKLRLSMGRQWFWTPGLVAGSAVLVERGTGISFQWPMTEGFSVEGWWLRARNDNYYQGYPASGTQWTHTSDSTGTLDDADFFSLRFPFKGDGFQLIPWVAYGWMGRNSSELPREVVAPAVWARRPLNGTEYQYAAYTGITGEYTRWEPFRFAFDVNYASIKGVDQVMNRSGWFGAISGEYAMKYFTPKIVAWYSSGDDGNISNGSERMPSITASWWTTSFGHSAYWLRGASHGYNTDNIHTSPVGLGGITFMLDKISFIDDLTQVLRVSYEFGTNDPSMAKYIRAVDRAAGDYTNLPMRQDYAVNYNFNSLLYLTRNDHLWEFNLDSVYKVYDNFNIVLEAGLIYLNLDKNTWRTQGGYDNINHRVALNFIYSF